MTMEGGEPPVDWAALATHIEHLTRKGIVEALCRVGPLSVPGLKQVIDDPDLRLACLAYHVDVLARGEVLTEIGRRPTGASIERVYVLSPSALSPREDDA